MQFWNDLFCQNRFESGQRAGDGCPIQDTVIIDDADEDHSACPDHAVIQDGRYRSDRM